MPGYIMHLSEATMILNKMRQKQEISKQWEELFLLGALLPDACVKGGKYLTHFWAEESLENRIKLPELGVFTEKYQIQPEEALMMGYWAHLHLDYRYFTEYWSNILEFRTEDGSHAVTRQEAALVWLKKREEYIPTNEFFSDVYCYGDYTKLNRWFCEKYQLRIPKYQKAVGRIPDEAQYERLEELLENLQHFMAESQEQSKEPTRIFDVVDLDQFFQKVAEEFYSFTKK